MKVSIITASYNYEQYIAECIESVIGQTYNDWELIVVDDGSSDRSVEIIKSYCSKDSRVKLFQHENAQNKGLKSTLLLGLELASGDWVAFLESDDTWTPDYLNEKIKVASEHPQSKLIFNKVEFLWGEGREDYNRKEFEAKQKKLSKLKFPKNMFYDFYMTNMILTFSSVMVQKDILKNADFDTPIDELLDWWLWIHLAHRCDFYYLDKALTKWNLHSNSYIENKKRPLVKLVNFEAYMDVYLKNKLQIQILFFVLFSSIFFFVAKTKRAIVRRLKKLLK